MRVHEGVLKPRPIPFACFVIGAQLACEGAELERVEPEAVQSRSSDPRASMGPMLVTEYEEQPRVKMGDLSG